jgi:thiamine-phosphate pyrophosphorylase
LLGLAVEAVAMAQGTPVRILINSRLDVALACRAHGLHLPAGMTPPAEWKRVAGPGFLVGVSCHDWAELGEARSGGADFAVLGPVFAPLSKPTDSEPMGLAKFGQLARAADPLPVLALGGITLGDALGIEEAGGAGLAGITLFQR